MFDRAMTASISAGSAFVHAAFVSQCSAQPMPRPGSARPSTSVTGLSASAVIALQSNASPTRGMPCSALQCPVSHLLRRRLTSDHPSRSLAAPVAAKQQIVRPPRVRRATFPLIPAASTATPSVQVADFEGFRLLIRCRCLVCDSCSSGQWFAVGTQAPADCLRIPPRDGHPCPRLAVPLAGPAADFHRKVIQPPPRVLE